MLGMARWDCESEEAYAKWLGRTMLYCTIMIGTVIFGALGLIIAIIIKYCS